MRRPLLQGAKDYISHKLPLAAQLMIPESKRCYAES
jgi:hypothetical protein